MTRTLVTVLVLGLLPTSIEPAAAQWLNHPMKGIPRTAEGRANLEAPPPRTADGHPDFSGIWGWQPGRFVGFIAQDLKPEEIQPWARSLGAQRQERMGQDDPSNYDCLPQGPRLYLYAPIPAKIVQTPSLLLILSEDLTYRQIFLDGRELPKDPDPSFMGYSIGRWDGDTLVVETLGYKDRTWLDFAGTPHSEKLRTTERIRRPTFGHLEIVETLEDPEVFARPFTVNMGAQFAPDTELLEFICAENERSKRHFSGTTSELVKGLLSQAVKVSPAILEKYVGTFDFRFPESPSTPQYIEVRVDNGQLTIAGAPAIPLSETRFFGGFGIFDVIRDERGVAQEMVAHVVEGEIRATRVTKK